MVEPNWKNVVHPLPHFRQDYPEKSSPVRKSTGSVPQIFRQAGCKDM